jgi:hypothetical protein
MADLNPAIVPGFRVFKGEDSVGEFDDLGQSGSLHQPMLLMSVNWSASSPGTA